MRIQKENLYFELFIGAIILLVLTLGSFPIPSSVGYLTLSGLLLLYTAKISITKRIEYFYVLPFFIGFFPFFYSFLTLEYKSDFFVKYSIIYFLISLGPVLVAQLADVLYRKSIFNLHIIDIAFILYVVFYVFYSVINNNKITYNIFFSFEEYTSSFSFSVFSIYFFSKKKWLWFLTALFFCFLAGKRIALLGVFACVPVFIFLKSYKFWKSGIVVIFCVLLESTYFYLVYNSLPFQIGFKSLGDGGRLFLYNQLENFNLLGNGVGSAVSTITVTGFPEFLLHSDSIQKFYELGFLGYGIYYLMLIVIGNLFVSKSNRALFFTFLTFLTLMSLSDNIHIYSLVLFPLIFILTTEEIKVYKLDQNINESRNNTKILP